MNLNLKSNAFWAAAETVIAGLSLFVLYKYVLVFVGVKGLGLWSLVLATTSLARFGDLGAAAGLSRFVAVARARNDETLAAAYVDTVFLTNLGLYGAFAAVFYFLLWYALSWVTPADDLPAARALLPYAIGSFVLLNLNAVMLAALIGAQRSDLKSKIMIASLVVQVAVVSVFIRSYGLEAMAWAQIAQNLFAMLVARVMACRLMTELGFLPDRFTRKAFRELLGFGLRLQAVNLVSFAFEPLTKFVISATSGLATLGLFEMAYRMVLQVRHVVVAPIQTLVPAFAHLLEADPKAVPGLYNRAMAGATVAGVAMLLVPLLASPLVSLFWIGHVDRLFILFTALCCVGWFANLVSAPAYLMGVSRGFLRGNIAGHAVASFASPVLAMGLFQLAPTNWVSVAVPMVGLAAGAVIWTVVNSAAFHLPAYPSLATLGQACRDLLALVLSPLRGRNRQGRQ